VNFDSARVPFSRFGAYFAISYLPATDWRSAGLYLRTLHGDAPHREICRIDLLPVGQVCAATIRATPALLRLECASGHAQIGFADAGTLRLRSEGVALRLTFFPRDYDHALPHPQGWEINCFSSRIRLALLPLQGALQVVAPLREGRAQQLVVETLADAAACSDISLVEWQTAWPAVVSTPTFAEMQTQIDTEFAQWLDRTPTVPADYAAARELAAYVQWSSVVAPAGYFSRPAMLMSKNWLSQVWSWDHCFNALALADQQPALAWDQLLLPFAQQNAEGALPDCLSDRAIVWNFTKPPVHGWALSRLLQRTALISDVQLREIYQPLARWTEWWLRYRDDNGNGIAQYNHGNDSGWDNCTVFDADAPIETPELSALLVVQMSALADVAARLGETEAAAGWSQRSEQLLQNMLQYFWRGDGFVAIDAHRREIKTPTLLLLMPLVLGKRLPPSIRDVLLAQLQRPEFFTAHGLASESTLSAAYQADGYWRGPIWAPAILLIVSGLADLGELALAREISRRFCDTVAASGVAENFDALSGAGLRDPAHTWTASVFLILAHDYL
jgi:glycogen debranching enzyme